MSVPERSGGPARRFVLAGGSRRGLAGGLGVGLVACALSWGTLGTPWIAEDAAILRHVHAAPPLDDLLGPQYGLALVRFWRPLVTLTWWLQEHTSGIAPAPLRTFNVLVHALGAVLLSFALARAGVERRAAWFAGLVAASFPYQGGTVTWLAGRTDGLVALAAVGVLAAAAAGRPWAVFAFTLLATATKEFAFVLPGWVALFLWGVGRSPRALAPAALASAAAAALGLGLRRLALGAFLSGYAGGGSGLGATDVALGIAHWAHDERYTWIALALLFAAALAARSARPRLFLAGCGLAVLGAVPLLPLYARSGLGDTNLRLLRFADVGWALAAAGLVAGAARASRVAVVLPVALASIGLGWRLGAARADVAEWSAAGVRAEAAVETARARAAEEAPRPEPLLWAGFPLTYRGAYCLGFGLADRFRAPFPESPRPVWPARAAFVDVGRTPPLLVEPDARGFLDPFSPAPSAGLVLTVDGSVPPARLVLDERVARDGPERSARLEVRGAAPGAPLEALLYTEIGLEAVPLGLAAADGRFAITLGDLCARGNDVATVGQSLLQSADLGAENAWLELRAWSADGSRLVDRTRPVQLAWELALVRRFAPATAGRSNP